MCHEVVPCRCRSVSFGLEFKVVRADDQERVVEARVSQGPVLFFLIAALQDCGPEDVKEPFRDNVLNVDWGAGALGVDFLLHRGLRGSVRERSRVML